MAGASNMVNEPGKMSFAKVAAASATPCGKAPVPLTKPADAANVKDKKPENPPAPDPAAAAPQNTAQEPSDESKLAAGLKDLKLQGSSPLNLVVNGSLSAMADKTGKLPTSQTPSDDTSQRADSSSELGTKPPSLDGKSITSGTTFALDEKESLRPDDSASVKAAAEDDDTFSIRGSQIPGSRMGSDVAARIQRLQIGDMPPRALVVHHGLAGNKSRGDTTPQSGASDKQDASDSKPGLSGGAATPDGLAQNTFYSQHPDEKLLEAMQSPRDRIFLLKLEQQVIQFVQDSKEPYMDLPPSNSFCRMLTHRLADYYHMTHSYEPATQSVRIFRTPFCRIPPSLSSIVASQSNNSSPAPVVMPRKIMRRGEDGDPAPVSATPSKPTSEAGSESKESKVAREKLTREEREEAYKQARQRIFGSAEKTEGGEKDGEEATGMSRASSVSAKDKTNGGKKKPNKQRRDDSETFESRSQYVPWCGPAHPAWGPGTPQYYFPINAPPPFNPQYQQQPYANSPQPQPIYVPAQPFPPQMMPSNGFNPPYAGGMTTYPTPPMPPAVPHTVPPSPQQGYRGPNPPMAAPYGSPVPGIPQPAWPQQGYGQNGYPPPRNSPVPVAGIPYAYGQLPAHANPNDPKSQHPIPGSYNRQFNPKTQSFVPGTGMPPQPPMPMPGPYAGSSPNHGSPRFHSPHANYGAFQQQMPPQPGYGGPPGPYGMARQPSNNPSGPPYHSPQHPQQSPQPAAQQQPPHVPSPHGPQHGSAPPPPSGPMHGMPNKPAGGPPAPPSAPSGPAASQANNPSQQQTFSHLPNYGNPATLPQKPTA